MKQCKFSTWLILALITVTGLKAQELTVTYSAKLNTNSPDLFKEAGLPDQMRQSLVNAYSNVELTYNMCYSNGESEFRQLPSDKKQEINFMGQKIDLNTMMAEQLKNVTYKNYKTNTLLNKTVFFGKTFLIKDTIQIESMEVVKGEKKEILGYECQKAVSKDGANTIWFTEYIPIKAGPIDANVKGLILEATMKEYIYLATKVSDGVDHKILPPSDGKVMTKKEFEEMVKKRTDMLKMGNNDPF